MLFMQDNEPKVVRFHLGTIADHTVYEAELVGLLLALHLLRSERDVTRAIIRLDNQAVLHALTTRESGPAQSIIDEVILQIELVANAARTETFRLDIAWIRGHVGNVGNERADKEVLRWTSATSSSISLPIVHFPLFSPVVRRMSRCHYFSTSPLDTVPLRLTTFLLSSLLSLE